MFQVYFKYFTMNGMSSLNVLCQLSNVHNLNTPYNLLNQQYCIVYDIDIYIYTPVWSLGGASGGVVASGSGNFFCI